MMAASESAARETRCSGDFGGGLAVRTSRLVGATATRGRVGWCGAKSGPPAASSEKHGGWTIATTDRWRGRRFRRREVALGCDTGGGEW
ncbi:hypothetical protein Scep_028468 [Stephania cephalantha]|uniref:Uncharacterized protein n=1 Tax=Stephania cephalantha TaxID=152367 RepID=A0AAP0HM40_9MAGN